MPLTFTAPAGYCPEMTPLQLPSEKSQMFPVGLLSHSLCSHLFGYHPPVVQAVSLQLVVVQIVTWCLSHPPLNLLCSPRQGALL